MPPSARSEARAFALGLAGIALVTLWRVALLPFDSADLFVDDAQYWFWGQELAWGYYSKPPLIGWILRASTDDRLRCAVLDPPADAADPRGDGRGVALVARRLYGARIGGLAGFAFVSLPGVALGSLLVSTDTPMLFCFALAMLAQLHLAERRSLGWALVLGAAVGVGLLAKYAMIYFPLAAALAALVLPTARIAWRDAGVAAVVALALVAPNLAWNAANEFATLQHTADERRLAGTAARPRRARRVPRRAVRRVGAGLLRRLPRRRRPARRDPARRYLALMSLPIFAIVSVQALISGANANWAAAGASRGAGAGGRGAAPTAARWLAAGLAINLAVTAALPVAAVFADTLADRLGQPGAGALRRAGRPQPARGRDRARPRGSTRWSAATAATLADFFYTLRDSGLAIYAEPAAGFPPHHYAQKHPLPPGPGEVLYVDPRRRRAGLPQRRRSTPSRWRRWRPSRLHRPSEIRAFRVPRRCWFPDSG